MVTRTLSSLGNSLAHRPLFAALGFCLAGGVIGTVAWNGQAALLPLAALLPVCFGLAPSRICAGGVAMGYFLAASRGLPDGAATFFGADIFVGVTLWLAASLIFVLIHALLWSKHPKSRAIGFGAATIFMAIPPFGILGWVSPLTAAGVMFPGLGWFGLLATFALLSVLASGKMRPVALCTVCVLWAAGLGFGKDPKAAEDWSGAETNVIYNIGSRDFQRAYEFVVAANGVLSQTETPIVVFPEGAAGWRTMTSETTWIDLANRTGKTLYAGAAQGNGEGYDNILVRITGTSFEVVYRQRMPVPVSMWRPWSKKSAQAHFYQKPVVMLDTHATAVLICYEQLLVWPILQSRLAGADHILGIANLWWADGTSIPGIQMAAMTAWARLFNMTLTTSVNT